MAASAETSTRPPAQRSKPRQVIANVNRYFDDKGFGFAEISGESVGGRPVQVFFHKSTGRVVNGTADEPVLTREPKEQYVSDRKSRYPSRLVMLVVPSDKGLRAIAWGIVPKRDWRVDLINGGGLDRYIGGEISSTRAHGRNFPQREYRGILDAVELTPTKLVITIKGTRIRNCDGFYVDADTPVVTLDYDLEFARTERAHYGRYVIRLYSDAFERQIVFNLPKEG